MLGLFLQNHNRRDSSLCIAPAPQLTCLATIPYTYETRLAIRSHAAFIHPTSHHLLPIIPAASCPSGSNSSNFSCLCCQSDLSSLKAAVWKWFCSSQSLCRSDAPEGGRVEGDNKMYLENQEPLLIAVKKLNRKFWGFNASATLLRRWLTHLPTA